MDLSLFIRQRLRELNLDQKDLAVAAEVTESYISQLLARKKAPPAPGRTHIYKKIGYFLKVPGEELSKLAEFQRKVELQRRLSEIAAPLFREGREWILGKCHPERRAEVQRIFEKEAFGELERLVMRKILDVVVGLARKEAHNEEWIRSMTQVSGCSAEELRKAMQELASASGLPLFLESRAACLEAMVASWDIDLEMFCLEVMLKQGLTPEACKRFEFVEVEAEQSPAIELGFDQFLKDKSLSGGATAEEIELLKALRFKGRYPSALYYYRELQSLRDPLHFRSTGDSASR